MTSILTLPSHMTGFLQDLGTQSGVYSYESKPRTMSPRESYSDVGGRPLGLMSDRRIIRGNTYSGTILAPSLHQGPTIRRRQQLGKGKNGSKKLPVARFSHLGRDPLAPSTPGARRRSTGVWSVPPVPGRRHLNLQTDSWLEEILDKKEEKEMGVQVDMTDSWEEEEDMFGQKRLEVKHNTNMVDKETQIYNNDPNLFVFDDEVEVVLESIIGRTVQQSMTEVVQEEELMRARITKQDHLNSVSSLS